MAAPIPLTMLIVYQAIRYYTQQVIDRIVAGRPILLEQRSRSTEQLVVPAISV